ncbi:UDP-N-acetylmuramoyl-tripeptide--D-alanyl-D-alanine ligase [Marinospirillum perlucidum]|uniref:UDP-N-acetylmuramoyl-tripeptide--D-alanyl-D- alanine ligase n=1 Tax=Marinospirillum perlucidum TaxID=1982602 RepID=UPI000DF32494|nr:UDP-N-acetylmuramoyl-tripeptide--D-alanyl-D-alanine ligase [Marinospirillum perlucidum]
MMHPLSAEDLIELVEGELRGNTKLPFAQVITDTRQLQAGCLFVALKGPRFDGHDFIQEARSRGAVLALVEDWVDDPLPQVKVASCLDALGQLGAWNRDLFQGPVVAVTGNSGKTTVKEMLAAIFSRHWDQVLATRGNLNNAIGVPLTLLELGPEHQAAVIELGANHLGEIAYLSELVQPDIGLITNVTGAHLGEFGSLEAIAEAKGELISALGKEQLLVLNAEDRFFSYWQQKARCRVLSFGLAQGEVCVQSDLSSVWGLSRFEVTTPWGVQACELQLPGRHNQANALASIAVAGSLGIDLAVQARVLADLQPVKGRLHRVNAYGGALLLDDSYNASPGAVKLAVDLLAEFPGKRFLALGHLAELGEATEAIHQELGEYARQKGLDALYTLAGPAEAAARGFGDKAQVFADLSGLATALKPHLDEQTCVLVKGSRSAGMDQLVKLLQPGSTDQV